MANKDDEMKYCLRLNLNNPEHLLIHKTLRNLNPEYYKSINQFIITGLLDFIENTNKREMLVEEEIKKQMGDELVTKSELREHENNMKAYLTSELMTAVISAVMSNLNIQTANVTQDKKEPEEKNENAEQDETLSELANLWY